MKKIFILILMFLFLTASMAYAPTPQLLPVYLPPADNAAANGLHYSFSSSTNTGHWEESGGTAPPCGANTLVQYSDGSVLDCEAGFTYDETTNTLNSVTLKVGSGTPAVATGAGDLFVTDAFEVAGSAVITNALGSNQVVNGTFNTDTNWTKGAGWTISGGTAVATNVN